MTKFQRKKLLIDPTSQLALVQSVALNWVCFLAIVVLSAVCIEIIVQYPDQSLGSLTQGVVGRHAQTLALMLLACPFFIYRSVKFSHRFAGPIWRLRREMKNLGAGNHVEPIRFRRRDFWQELADDFNRVLMRIVRAERGLEEAAEFPPNVNSSVAMDHDLAAP